MAERYKNIPKKRKVYVDKDGQMYGLGKRSLDTGEAAIYTGSGTLLSDGHLTLSGSQFKYSSIIVPAYHGTTVGSGTLVVELGSSQATFRGVASSNFFYSVFN